MAEESVFEKRHVEPSAKGNVEGLLEHFNLPPAVIGYVRRNRKTLQIACGVIVVAVVAIVAYDTYRDKLLEKSTSALSTAMQMAGDEKEKALQHVLEEYSGTATARWANVELAHIDMEKKRFKEAAGRYGTIRDDIDTSDPLYALTVFGTAQAFEAAHEYDAASAAYQQLQDIDGYQVIGYTGLARILDVQGKSDKALETLNAALTALADKPQDDPGKRAIEERIARLKVRL